MGTWCLHEIYEALEKGYKICEIFELIYYEKKMRIFEQYVAKFYCLKTQYSGISEKNDIDAVKKQLSDELLRDFRIHVKWSDIPTDKNEAMRYVMKLILNSLWGKLCQNPNKSSVYFVNDYEELMCHIENKKYESVYFDVLDCNVARVVCNYREEHNYKVNKVCVSVGSYITCYSRLKLLKYLNKLPEKSVLYYDTDSIFYFSEHCEEILDTDMKLGCLSSELKNNQHINVFVSTGPKSYSYVTNDLIEITHVKGFKLSKTLSENPRINFDSLCEILECRNISLEIDEKDAFQIDKRFHIYKKDRSKRLSFTFDKRKINEDLTTVPWGYKTQ